MKTVDKTINVSQTEEVFKDYVNRIVKILKSKRIRMIKKVCDNLFSWESCRDKKNCANVHIVVFYNLDQKHVFDLFVSISTIGFSANINSLEGMIMEKTKKEIDNKYPLSNFHIQVNPEESGRPPFKPVKETAKQLYLALKCHNKISSSKTALRIERVEKRIKKIIEKEASVIAESFFQ